MNTIQQIEKIARLAGGTALILYTGNDYLDRDFFLANHTVGFTDMVWGQVPYTTNEVVICYFTAGDRSSIIRKVALLIKDIRLIANLGKWDPEVFRKCQEQGAK